MTLPARNNLQWLRLLFAWQVVVTHASAHLGTPPVPLLNHFPGVPAFFFVSGMLIYHSYTSRPEGYWRNRFLRLFPGLLAVSFGGLGVVLLALGWRDLIGNPGLYAGWFVGQITLGQAFNPDHFRTVGVGVVNGSLWTITTEILFYACVPVIVWLERDWRWTVGALTALSFGVYAAGPALETVSLAGKSLREFLALTPIYWGWMFGAGILACKHFNLLWVRAAPLVWPVLLVLIARGEGLWFGSTSDDMGVLYFLGYAWVIAWLAFHTPYVPLKPDFSYGTYIWHMPVVNLLTVLGAPSIWLAFGLTAFAAAMSWYAIERPSLRLKSGARTAPEPGPGEGEPGRDAIIVAP